jgi:[acyl-carrier-protein] S-malonyltransferase
MKALIFPGQGSQFEGMGKDLYESSERAKSIFKNSNNILDFDITDIMFNGSIDDLKKTDITQPAIFIHSYICYELGKIKNPSAYAGHSLGEFTALTCSGSLCFEDGLSLVLERARAMNDACSEDESTMAAILGMDDNEVIKICQDFDDIDPANFNCPGQVVISGSSRNMSKACDIFKSNGAKAIPLKVGGGFHSVYMEPAKSRLEDAIMSTNFQKPNAPIYQNVDSKKNEDIELIKQNLVKQLTSPVLWTQTIENMINDEIDLFIECGPGRVLQGLVKKINRKISTESI